MRVKCLAPCFFPLRDNAIALAYGLALQGRGRNADSYWQFMETARDQWASPGGEETFRRNPLRAIDEYNFCKFTKRLMLTPCSLPTEQDTIPPSASVGWRRGDQALERPPRVTSPNLSRTQASGRTDDGLLIRESWVRIPPGPPEPRRAPSGQHNALTRGSPSKPITLTTPPIARTIALLCHAESGGEPRCFVHPAAARTLQKRTSAIRAASS